MHFQRSVEMLICLCGKLDTSSVVWTNCICTKWLQETRRTVDHTTSWPHDCLASAAHEHMILPKTTYFVGVQCDNKLFSLSVVCVDVSSTFFTVIDTLCLWHESIIVHGYDTITQQRVLHAQERTQPGPSSPWFSNLISSVSLYVHLCTQITERNTKVYFKIATNRGQRWLW